jgi:hypothetical protein
VALNTKDAKGAKASNKKAATGNPGAAFGEMFAEPFKPGRR